MKGSGRDEEARRGWGMLWIGRERLEIAGRLLASGLAACFGALPCAIRILVELYLLYVFHKRCPACMEQV